MPVSAELRSVNHAIDDLRSAVLSLRGKFGNVPAVARLAGDLDRLILDAADIENLPMAAHLTSAGVALGSVQLSDEPYDPAMWADDSDDEGLGGYHGTSR